MAMQETQYQEQLRVVRALVERQAHAWERNDFDLAASDWLPDGELISPGGRVSAARMRSSIQEFHRLYKDLVVTITNVFSSPDGSKVAIEWTWSVTRRRDGARSDTHDGILVDLVDGKIRSWREYYDLSTSVEAPE